MSESTLSGLLARIRPARAAGAPVVMATILSTEGSTYRKAGACMLIHADGSTSGMLGGGSFEQELAGQAQPVLQSGNPMVINCEMPSPRDTDPGKSWERDGMARILLQRFAPDNDYQPLGDLARALAQSKTAVLVSVVDSDDPAIPAGTNFLCATDSRAPLPATLSEDVQATAATVLGSAAPMLVHQHTGAGEAELFYLPVYPPLHLLILGAVPDSVPVSRFARVLGWRNTIADPRSGFCIPDRFPDADAVLNVNADNLEAVLNLDKVDAALLLTRSFDHDRHLLATLARSRIPFVGILGSRTRCAKLMESLGSDAARLQGRIHGPVGLEMRCDTPDEIALSIVAQIQATYRPGQVPVAPPAATTAPVPPAARAPMPTAAPATSHPPMPALLWAIVLAAGGSSRFGGFKQLLEWEGESLLRRTVRIATGLCGNRVVVVHGPKPTKCQRELNSFDVRHVFNEHWESGMALSLKCGLRTLPPECTGALILLCDQPLLRPDRVGQLAELWQHQSERIVASAYHGAHGVPAIFPRRLFPELLKLTGDRGARTVIDAHMDGVLEMEMPEAAVDIDTQEDYAALITKGGRTT
ncbi:MAG: NTP transferase domain-containing protein [Gammaproteobacteria bacterium]|nr:NTP transferase domain-containing protein [Gammaproteobacteria bacterium]